MVTLKIDLTGPVTRIGLLCSAFLLGQRTFRGPQSISAGTLFTEICKGTLLKTTILEGTLLKRILPERMSLEKILLERLLLHKLLLHKLLLQKILLEKMLLKRPLLRRTLISGQCTQRSAKRHCR